MNFTQVRLRFSFFLLCSGYKDDGLIKFDEPVPFRLTRNLEVFLNSITQNGTFSAVMTATAMCLSHYKEQLKHHLSLFLRDDLIAWQSTDNEVQEREDDRATQAEHKKKLKATIETNLTAIMERIKTAVVPMQADNNKVPVP